MIVYHKSYTSIDYKYNSRLAAPGGSLLALRSELTKLPIEDEDSA